MVLSAHVTIPHMHPRVSKGLPSPLSPHTILCTCSLTSVLAATDAQYKLLLDHGAKELTLEEELLGGLGAQVSVRWLLVHEDTAKLTKLAVD